MEAALELGKVAESLRIEREEDFALHEAMLKRRSIQERRKAGLTWFPLKIADSGYGIGSYPFLVVENPGEKQKHYFQSSAPVQLFSQAKEYEDESIQGTIGYVDDTRMKIIFYCDELPEWVDAGKIGVNLLFDTKSYDEMFRALNTLINADKGRLPQLRDVILGYRKASFQRTDKVGSDVLNASQNEALQSIADAEDMAIVHGPPGTGKTTTLVEAIRMLAQREQQVLVCAPSNAAVDHLTRSLAARGLNTVRIGNLARIEQDAGGHTVDALLQNDREYKQVKELKRRAADLRKMGSKYKRQFGREEAEQRKLLFTEARNIGKEARELESYLVKRILDQAQAICCTLIGATHEYIRDRQFTSVVIDEAGQALEPACWVPVLKAQKVVMAGDPFQLPPTVKSREAAQKGLSRTLLEKAIARQPEVNLLRTQYRMHEMIMTFSNRQFYGDKLEAADSVRLRHLPQSPDVVEFIDTAGCGWEEEAGQDQESRCNPGEAQALRKHLDQLLSIPPNDYSVAVISPYRAQVALLEELCADLPQVTVNTIDSFQGQERDVVYISLVRSNNDNDIGFLKDYRRMNVAMTRARKKLVVIGDSATLGNDRFYAAFLEFVESHGAYRTGWEFM
jgi:ATP-dependent RNA/DNA helicase IGHMBP2